MSYLASVVIPAHNEERCIGGLVARLADADPDGALELVVVANGCTDRTAAAARAASARATVIEIPTASKTAALNAGDDAATALPRVYLDADARIDAAAIRALADALAEPEVPRVAAPRVTVDASGANWLSRQYHAVWAQTDYLAEAHVGDGVYALSRAARGRFGRFPQLIADDRFVQRLFRPDECVVLADHSFTVPASPTLRAHVRRHARVIAGNDELEELGRSGALALAAEGAPSSSRFVSLLGRVARRPALWPGAVIYLATGAAARIAARRMRRRGRIEWSSVRV